jgi:hypothetical protein
MSHRFLLSRSYRTNPARRISFRWNDPILHPFGEELATEMNMTESEGKAPAKPASAREASAKQPKPKTPPAGPHARDGLTDYDKTPGTGALPEKGQDEADVGPD